MLFTEKLFTKILSITIYKNEIIKKLTHCDAQFGRRKLQDYPFF
jgi:hypothetical protein